MNVEEAVRRIEEAINPLLAMGNRVEEPRCEICGTKVDPIGKFTITLAHEWSHWNRRIDFFCNWGCFVKWAEFTVMSERGKEE